MSSKSHIIVAGGGHAGVEAALSAARMGLPVTLITQDVRAIARMSCNPAIGGLAKGHLVREIDALGGEMGVVSDIAGIQFKTLNKSKGRAVWGNRAQVDKLEYARHMQSAVNNIPGLAVQEGEVIGFRTHNGHLSSILLADGSKIHCNALIITSGTFLNGLIHIGTETYSAGRFGEKPARGLTEALNEHGITTGRLKTGTPPRLLKKSINWEGLELAMGDLSPTPFSARTPRPFNPINEPCFITYTGEKSHGVLADSLHMSAMYSGKIKGVGPRYCPSIEDKIVRFADRLKHQLFLEPEWRASKQIYVNGFSTSMPRDVQQRAINAVAGLEQAVFIRPGYAIEYDYCLSAQLKTTLESKTISGLYCAGQINGTSGYEEAAAQGLLAGINAACKLKALEPVSFGRNEAYIGVLIDDLITKIIDEPYRMFTSRAEYRLTLRPDTADLRLTETGRRLGLVSNEQYDFYLRRLEAINQAKEMLAESKIQLFPDDTPRKALRYLLNPNISVDDLDQQLPALKEFPGEALFTAETDIKYAGYLERESLRIEQLKELERVRIPEGFDFRGLNTISIESREKLSLVRPETLGQASRIAGVNPSDISVLSVLLKRR